MIQCGGLALQLFLFSSALPQPVWAVVVLPYMNVPIAQHPLSIQINTEGTELFETKGACWYQIRGLHVGQDIFRGCSLVGGSETASNWRRRWSLVSPRRGQNTMVPVAMSIPCSPGSNEGEAQLPQMY